MSCLLCAKCCEQTEMLLANEDIDRIKTQVTQSRQSFAYLRDGYLYLRNKGEYCVFLDPQTRRCTIYEIRPMGCRYYPVVYNPFLKKCVIDEDCSNKENIPSNKIGERCPSIEKFILLLEEERNNRLRSKSQQKRK